MTASRLSDLTVDDFDDAPDDLTVHGKRMARGTEPLHEDVGSQDLVALLQLANAPQETAATAGADHVHGLEVALHEALTLLRDLESILTRAGGHMWHDEQQALFTARELLKKHGRR